MNRALFFTILLTLLPLAEPASAQKPAKPKPEKPVPAGNENDYYKLDPFTFPKGEVLECGGLDFLPDGKLAIGTRRGELWIVENPHVEEVTQAKFSRFAHGLHEVLGVHSKDGWIYTTQRCEYTRLKDSDGDGKADLFETINDGWEINGDYHEYAFGSRPDKDGNVWIVLCLTGSFNSNCKYRGWCVRITPEGKIIPTCSGVRSPGGIGMNAEGDVFYTDNQGPWNGTCGLKHLVPGHFVGHPDGNKWWDEKLMGSPRPASPMSGSRFMTEAKKIPQYVPAAILFPYQKMGNSTSGLDCDLSGGKFGPFEKQLFVGDQTASTINRVFLEKVNGRYQGALFPFRQGMGSGVVPVRFAANGSLFVGGTNRGWGSRGKFPFSLDRITWTGKLPFEIHEMRAKPDGFELTFTKPVDPNTVSDLASYTLQTYTYIYQATYGSPEVDHTKPTITKAEPGKDGKSVRLYIDGLQEGHVHELMSPGVRSKDNEPLLHKEAYYTLNYIPKK